MEGGFYVRSSGAYKNHKNGIFIRLSICCGGFDAISNAVCKSELEKPWFNFSEE
jgi:hypothetical protein